MSKGLRNALLALTSLIATVVLTSLAGCSSAVSTPNTGSISATFYSCTSSSNPYGRSCPLPESGTPNAASPASGTATLPAPAAYKSAQPNIAYLISSMKVGEKCYTVPWAMWLDSSDKFWLNPSYQVTSVPTGTSHMQVARTVVGYQVTLSTNDSDELYTPVDKPDYVGETEPWIPVTVVRKK